MSQFPSDDIEAALASVEAEEKALIELAGKSLQAYGGTFYPIDFLAIAALNRAVALSSGFRTLIRERNLICAGALIRLQLDTALRFFAAFIVDKPHEFASKILEGDRIDRMYDRYGNRMTDSHLVAQLAKEYPWIEEAYRKTSSYVHLSGVHILSTLSMEDAAARRIGIKVSPHDKDMSDDVYIDAINTLRACTRILARYVDGWTFTKDNPDEVSRIRQVLEGTQREP